MDEVNDRTNTTTNFFFSFPLNFDAALKISTQEKALSTFERQQNLKTLKIVLRFIRFNLKNAITFQ